MINRDVTTEVILDVARALNAEAGRQRNLSRFDDWEDITDEEREGWRLMACAALAAMRQPVSYYIYYADEDRTESYRSVSKWRKAIISVLGRKAPGEDGPWQPFDPKPCPNCTSPQACLAADRACPGKPAPRKEHN